MIVLDTHIWLWWVNEDWQKIKPIWRSRIEQCEEVGVSAISCFAVAWLARHGRIELPCPVTDWFPMALDGSDIRLLPITPEIASCAVGLAQHHSDPQDRLIIATALTQAGKLISADTKFVLYEELSDALIT